MAFTAHLHGGPHDQRTYAMPKFNEQVMVAEERELEAFPLKGRQRDIPHLGPAPRIGVYLARPGTRLGGDEHGSADYDWQGWA